jgi:type II secretory pathway pseudopilin PulG
MSTTKQARCIQLAAVVSVIGGIFYCFLIHNISSSLTNIQQERTSAISAITDYSSQQQQQQQQWWWEQPITTGRSKEKAIVTDDEKRNFLFFPSRNTTLAVSPKESHSQKGQDLWVLETVGSKLRANDRGRPLFFVDLAANQPIKLSNSKKLEDNGWTGLCIDGNQDLVSRLRNERTCAVVEAVVDACDGHRVSWLGHGTDPLGGIVGMEYDNREGGEAERVTTTLESILVSTGAPSVIDYLSLDVEGAEWRVLQHFPFERYTFRSITVERPPPWLNRLLVQKGYLWIKNHMFDSFYVHESEPNAQALNATRHYKQILSKCHEEEQGSKGGCPWPEEESPVIMCN